MSTTSNLTKRKSSVFAILTKTDGIFNVNLRHKIRKNYFKYLLIVGNVVVLSLIVLVVVTNNNNFTSRGSINSITSINTQSTINPLDQVSSADIALTVAQMTNLPEAVPISNQADTQQAEIAMAATDNNVVSKPQVVLTALKSRANISDYVVQPTDTITSIAHKFNISVNSLRWSNGLIGNNLITNQTLVIPPLNGIVYTVKAGDTPASLAKTYNASAKQIIAYNDAEITGLVPGEQIIIPNGTEPKPVYSFSPSYGYNGYDFGWCTWYVATQIAVPDNWGNASTWAYNAILSGWQVSSTPVVGAIAQTPYTYYGEGHVAVVRAINPNGTIWISEMYSYGQKSMTNPTPTGGWDIVDWKVVPASMYPNYIYR